MTAAMIALVGSFGGSAAADDAVEFAKKKLINGSTIKSRSIAGGKLKRNTVGGTEVNESKLAKVPSAANADKAASADRATDATNATNATNAADATNATNATNATSATNATNLGGAPASEYRRYGETIPSGKTVVGAWGLNHNNLNASELAYSVVQFPAAAPTGISAGEINFAPHADASDDDATCTGTVGSPTAPAGKVCLYFGSQSANVSFMSGVLYTAPFDENVLGFTVAGQATAAGDIDARGTWAYTAP